MKHRMLVTALLCLLCSMLVPATLAQGPTGKATPPQPQGSVSTGVAPADTPAPVLAEPEALWPGPDGYGYVGSSYTYNWVDISTGGTAVPGLGDDSFGGPFNVGFNFSFYGTNRTTFFVGSNGYLTFDSGQTDYTPDCPFPNAGRPNDMIAIMWADLYPHYDGTNAGVWYRSYVAGSCPLTGYAGHACTIVMFKAWYYCCGTTPSGTWEIAMIDNGDVVWQYNDGGQYNGANAGTGMEDNNAGANYGLQWGCGAGNSTPDGTAFKIGLPPAGLYIFPDVKTFSGCNGVPSVQTFSLFNHTGSAGTFDMTYGMTTTNGTISGPGTVGPVNNGASVNLNVTMTPRLCAQPGDHVIGWLRGQGNGYTDESAMDETAPGGGVWTAIASEPNTGRMDNALGTYNDKIYDVAGYGADTTIRVYDPAAGTWTTLTPSGSTPPVSYVRSGCSAGNTVYVYGDATGSFTGLRSYNMQTNTWTALTPGGTAPAQTGIWAPAWAYDPQTGYCYMTGGATTPGAGNLTTVYVYNPATNAWLAALPNFTSIRDLHAAWIFVRPSDSHKFLCVGGGNNGAGITSTQCYDLNTSAWAAENATIGALPFDWWGMGYGVTLNGSTPNLWLTDGVVAGGLSNSTYYYDARSNSWVDGGVTPSGTTYRTSAAVLNNEIYKIAGSMGEFTYSGLSDRRGVCPLCGQIGILQGTVLDAENGNVPCVDAEVTVNPGNHVLSVDPGTGAYGPIVLISGTYSAAAMAPGYLPDGPYSVVIQTNVTTTQDLAMQRPVINTDPTAYDVQVMIGMSITLPLHIHNDGHGNLTWEIREIPAGTLSRPESRQTPAAIGVDSFITAQFAAAPNDPVDFFVSFWNTADLSGAENLTAKAGKVQFVRNALRTAADTAQARVREYLDGRGISYKVFDIDNTILVRGNQTLMAELARFPEVSGFYGNHTYQLMPVESKGTAPAPNATIPWDIQIMQVDRAWNELGVTGAGVIVANVDTGVYYQHEALFPNYLCGSGPHTDCWFDPDGGTTTPNDSNGHGTETMSQMAADNNPSFQYSVGDAPDAGWIACLGCPGGSCPNAVLNSCADWLVMTTPNTPDVVNNSWGEASATCDTWYQGKIQAYRAAGIVPVWAAGNIGNTCNTSTPPANNVGTLAVGATTAADAQASFSSTGPGLCTGRTHFPDVSAPGENTCAATNTGGYTCGASGTSFASPRTAGCAALVKSANPSLTVDQIIAVIEASADNKPNTDCGSPQPDPNYRYGEGRVNCYNAVAAVSQSNIPWVWEDPITGTIPGPGNQIVDVTFECTPTMSGIYTGTLRVLNNDPCDSPLDIPLTLDCVVCEPPTGLAFTWAPPSPLIGEVVTLNGVATGTLPLSYAWDYGDGTLGAGNPGTHAYAAAGSYTVVMTVTNGCGESATVQQVVTVYAGCLEPGGASFTWAPPNPAAGDLVTLEGAVISGTNPLTFTWDFRDGGTGGGATVTHTYAADGVYTVTLTVANPCGQTTALDLVTVQAPVTVYNVYLSLIYKNTAP